MEWAAAALPPKACRQIRCAEPTDEWHDLVRPPSDEKPLPQPCAPTKTAQRTPATNRGTKSGTDPARPAPPQRPRFFASKRQAVRAMKSILPAGLLRECAAIKMTHEYLH